MIIFIFLFGTLQAHYFKIEIVCACVYIITDECFHIHTHTHTYSLVMIVYIE